MNAMILTPSDDELADLVRAKALLESPGLAMRLANAVGAPLEYLVAKKLPKAATDLINEAARKAVEAGFHAAAFSLRRGAIGAPARMRLHQFAVAGTGAVGGFFGLPGLLVELPVTTTAILRSIADIARSEGESPADGGTRLACIEVLAFGTARRDDDGSESGYFATRAALAQQVTAATRFVTGGLGGSGAPAVVRLINGIAGRFSVPVTQKTLAQAAPLVGAASGAALNLVFMRHFQDAARGHFIIRRLERAYGADVVRAAYERS